MNYGHIFNMLVIFLRSLITYVLLLIVMRFMGKRQIGEMQPFEFIVTLLISELACIPLSDVSIPLLYGFSAIIAVFILHQIFSIIEQSGQKPKFIISGKPSVVINSSGVDFLELKRNNLDVEDLIESLRILGCFSLDEARYAILESNGKLSVLADENKKSEKLPVVLVNNGRLNLTNMSKTQMETSDIKKIAKKANINSVEEIAVLTIDGDGKYYVQKEGQNYSVGNYDLKGGVKW